MSARSQTDIREDFPILKRTVHGKPLVYLDNAATSEKPTAVIEAEKQYYEQHNANIHRAIHQLSQEATEIYDKAHKEAASFIGASGMEEVIFTKNATESLNLAAYSLTQDLKKGDEIVVTEMEHHSNFVPWQQLAKLRGLTVKYVTVTPEGTLDEESLNTCIGPKTKVVAVAQVSNALGTINDVKKITSQAHEQGALVVVDGAQSIPHFSVDMKKLDVDLFAFSAHKMYGPTGMGVLYGKQDVLDNMSPFLYGGDMINSVSVYETTFNRLPWKFEAGTPNIAGAAALSATFSYLNEIGMDAIEKMETEVASYAYEKLSDIKGLDLYGPEKRAGVFSFNLEGIHPHDVASILDSEGVAIRTGHHCTIPLMDKLGVSGTCRASLGVYNTPEDVDALVEGLEKVKQTLS